LSDPPDNIAPKTNVVSLREVQHIKRGLELAAKFKEKDALSDRRPGDVIEEEYWEADPVSGQQVRKTRKVTFMGRLDSFALMPVFSPGAKITVQITERESKTPVKENEKPESDD
jgi:hypothetical protein